MKRYFISKLLKHLSRVPEYPYILQGYYDICINSSEIDLNIKSRTKKPNFKHGKLKTWFYKLMQFELDKIQDEQCLIYMNLSTPKKQIRDKFSEELLKVVQNGKSI